MLPAALILLLIVFAVAALIGTNVGREIFGYLEKYLPGGGGITTSYYKIAKFSAEALFCAVNSVAKGENMCQDYKQPSELRGGKAEAPSPPSSSGSIMETFGPMKFSGNVLNTPTASYADSGQGEEIRPDQRAWVECKDDSSKIDYYVISEAETLLQCDCSPAGSAESSETSASFGFTRKHALEDCHGRISGDVVFGNCRRINVGGSMEAGKWYTGIISDSEKASGKITKCDCQNNLGEQYFVYGRNEDEARYVCESDTSIPPGSSIIAGMYKSEIKNCEGINTNFLLYKGKVNGIDISSEYERISQACTVHNFQLPQDISTPEDWIPFHGDPLYIVYWNMFPIEESSQWNFKVDWGVHTAIFAISIIPWGRLTSAAISAGFSALGKQVTKQAAKEALKASMKQKLVDIIVNRLNKQGIKKGVKYLTGVGAKAVILETGATVLELADSISEKYEPAPGQMVLKSPLKNSDKYKLDESWGNKPVLIRWRPELGEATANFHLVSPCYFKSFEVKKQDVSCTNFIDDADNGASLCENPTEDKEDKIECGDISTSGINRYFGIDNAHTITNVRKSGKTRMYEYDENGRLEKIYMPYYSVDAGKEIYIDNIAYVSTDIKEQISSFGGELATTSTTTIKTYRGRLHSGAEQRETAIICTYHDVGVPVYDVDIATSKYNCFVDDSEFGMNLGNPKVESKISIKTTETCDVNKAAGCTKAIDVISQPATTEGSSSSEELTLEKGRFFEQKIKIGGGVQLLFIDYTSDGGWDTIQAKKIGGSFTEAFKKYTIIMSDLDDKGEPHNIKMTYCDTDAIIVDMGWIGGNKLQGYGSNYCIRHKTGTELVIKWGGAVVGTGIAIAGLVSGAGTLPTIAILAAGATVEQSTEILTDYSGSWPR